MGDGDVSAKFTPEETARLFKRFLRLDRDMSGGLDVQELMALPKIAENPLASQIVAVFDRDGNGQIDFEEFLEGLGVFAKSGPADAKFKFLFRIYDLNNDGYISNGDLFQVLRRMTGEQLSDVQLQQLVDKTIREADGDGDGRLSFDEFKGFVAEKNQDFLSQLKIDSGI